MKSYNINEMWVVWLRLKSTGAIIKQVLYHETKENALKDFSCNNSTEEYEPVAITKGNATCFIEGEGLETTKTKIKEVISHEEI